MNPSAARLALLALVVLAVVALGFVRRRLDGRARPVAGVVVLGSDDLAAPLGSRATLVQFSTDFCAPCRAARRVLGAVARDLPGVVHLEVDAAARADLVRRLGIRRTPTVLVLDASGRVVGRAGGVPAAAEIHLALAGTSSG